MMKYELTRILFKIIVREKKYKKYKKLSEIILNIITWFDKYPDIVKNITQA